LIQRTIRLPYAHLMEQRMQAPVMRSVNGIGLLNLICEHGPVSRASLAKMSNLSKPTVSSQVESLIHQGYVIELGLGKSGIQGGKKPTLIEFNLNCGLLVGIDINAETIRVASADMEGNIRQTATLRTEPEKGATRVLSKVKQAVAKVLEHDAGHPGKIRVIAIAAPGRVDARRGVVAEAGNLFQWENVPLREKFEAAFGVPVVVDNDVNMAALAEMAYGRAKGERDFVLIRLGTGIGSGVVMDGRLHHGTHWAAGEIAHTILDLRQADADWTARGYLESVVSEDRLAAKVRAAAEKAPRLAALVQERGELPALFEAAEQGDSLCKALVHDVIFHLGVAITNVIIAHDPALVVLQGAVFNPILEDIKAIVSRSVPWPTRVCLSSLADDAAMSGAIVAARTHAYERIARTMNQEHEPPPTGVATETVL
jgi:predicted NBD/HSP70 family sugar kinase